MNEKYGSKQRKFLDILDLLAIFVRDCTIHPIISISSINSLNILD